MSDAMKHQLDDIALKLRSARDAANRPGATEKDKADLKLIEQDYIAAQQRLSRESASEAKPGNTAKKLDRKLDEALKGTFPASDPVSFVQAAPVKEQDRTLPSVKVAEQQQPGKTAAARKSK